MAHGFALMFLFLTALLTGCSSDTRPTPEQRGFGESELYDPARNPNGAMVKAGHTLALAIEAAGDGPARAEGDTGETGFDEVWFMVEEAGSVGLKIADQAREMVARIELRDRGGSLLLAVDHAKPEDGLDLAPGQYRLRIFAGHSESEPMTGFLQFRKMETVGQKEPGLRESLWSWAWVMVGGDCRYCDLKGADLSSMLHIRARDLSYANLDQAKLTGVNLSDSNLSYASLWDSDLSYTNLTRVNLFQVYLGRTNRNYANLSGATWTAQKDWDTSVAFTCAQDPLTNGVASGLCLCGTQERCNGLRRVACGFGEGPMHCWVETQ